MRSFIFTTYHVLILNFSSPCYSIYSFNMIINNISHSSFNYFSNLIVPAIPVLLPQQTGSGGEIFVQCQKIKFHQKQLVTSTGQGAQVQGGSCSPAKKFKCTKLCIQNYTSRTTFQIQSKLHSQPLFVMPTSISNYIQIINPK